MKTEPRRIRHAVLITGAVALASAALVGGVTAAPAAPAAPSAPDRAVEAAPRTQEIATSTLGKDLKVTLTAVRSTSDPYAATARLAAYAHTGGGWKLQDRVSVGKADSWFWFPLTGSQAVCAFSVSSGKPERIAVSLLRTPSLGCSPTHRYHLDGGHLVAD